MIFGVTPPLFLYQVHRRLFSYPRRFSQQTTAFPILTASFPNQPRLFAATEYFIDQQRLTYYLSRNSYQLVTNNIGDMSLLVEIRKAQKLSLSGGQANGYLCENSFLSINIADPADLRLILKRVVQLHVKK